jgi:hypothetical protein
MGSRVADPVQQRILITFLHMVGHSSS